MNTINVALASNQLSSKFVRAGFSEDKNFIQLPNGMSLLETVLKHNFKSLEGELLVVVPQHQIGLPQLVTIKDRMREVGLSVHFLGAPKTPSAFSTLLWAADFIGTSPLRVLPGDALVSRPKSLNRKPESSFLENYMLVSDGSEERWGFVKVADNGAINGFEAKNPISTTIFTGEFLISSGKLLSDLLPSVLLVKNQESHPHLGEVFMLSSEGQPRSAVSSLAFTPLASPGDVRKFSESLQREK